MNNCEVDEKSTRHGGELVASVLKVRVYNTIRPMRMVEVVDLLALEY